MKGNHELEYYPKSQFWGELFVAVAEPRVNVKASTTGGFLGS
jgi:hypothetical protein